jgi:hypothetical protein
MVPALIRYTDDMPAWMGGYAQWFYIAIRPKYKDDKGIHAHELEHVKQWWLTTLLFAIMIAAICYRTGFDYGFVGLSLVAYQLLYGLVPWFKLRCEVECYKEQMKHYSDDRAPLFAKFISEKYNLNVTQQHALNLLRG